ncbi:regulatory LuxR family protein [Melghiribacillus thermohalophilus]|uniref:Regulatory LuxR family protein n=1 Tax=Melghiribacillus thermohalophilus TaxID=1324956 RepID=A0A4R3N8M8_9BACI|nr:response regulator transcription factor [Melghiribacillus thermohalophilus]TCT24937.1 regulatory LuxR family protein [Melghiribacillus thermohalophilus]
MAKVNAQLRRREQYAQINIDFPSTKETSESDQQLLEDLTPYEKQMLRLIAQGLSNKQIAERLNYSLGTVKVYNNRIYSKLNVNNRYEAILKASLLHQLD